MIRVGGIYRFSSPVLSFVGRVSRRHDTGYWVIPYGSRKGFPLGVRKSRIRRAAAVGSAVARPSRPRAANHSQPV